ncbi:MAG: efflux RND transporter periplasmic adaptor subunit [Halioglobus sp.]|nr:efflux RND transporter periplasmic adaptor subunit [Halioglobus sp.]
MSRFVCIAVLVALLTACAEETPPPRTVEVVVAEVVKGPFQPKSRYVGRLQAQEDVAIQARVTGYVQSREFHEGDRVAAGDVLYILDSSEYEAGLARARAELAAAKANQANAERNYRRGVELLPKGAISQAQMDDLKAKKLDADARIAAAEAQITSAEVNLGYTTITAPINGRIGSSAVSPGDLVGPNTGNLTTLVSVDPIEALFQVSEATYVAALAGRMDKELDVDELRNIVVRLELANGVAYSETGSIDFFANRVDRATGTIEARARIPNPHSNLVPGQYVRVILTGTTPLEALFVPQAAVQADQRGSFVLIVDGGNQVVRRGVELGERREDQVVVKAGLDEGDRVIVRGLQQVRPGMPVEVKSLPVAEQ